MFLNQILIGKLNRDAIRIQYFPYVNLNWTNGYLYEIDLLFYLFF